VGDFKLYEDDSERSCLVDVAKEIENNNTKYEHLNGKVS